MPEGARKIAHFFGKRDGRPRTPCGIFEQGDVDRAGSQMLFEIHAGMEDANHLDAVSDRSVKEKMRTAAEFPITCADVVAGPAKPGIVGDHAATVLNLTDVGFRLRRAPSPGGVGPNFLKVSLGAWP
jgi:hypothetical protein